MKIDLLELYYFVIAGITMVFAVLNLGDLVYTLAHMAILNIEDKYSYGNVILKNIALIAVFGGVFYYHFQKARAVSGGASKKKK